MCETTIWPEENFRGISLVRRSRRVKDETNRERGGGAGVAMAWHIATHERIKPRQAVM